MEFGRKCEIPSQLLGRGGVGFAEGDSVPPHYFCDHL